MDSGVRRNCLDRKTKARVYCLLRTLSVTRTPEPDDAKEVTHDLFENPLDCKHFTVKSARFGATSYKVEHFIEKLLIMMKMWHGYMQISL